ncbi:MAG: D-alanyl-D-alanine carboxypeptidase/D-alanyl-D-alanine-endopeptidase [Burkholderiaceae bacterium]
MLDLNFLTSRWRHQLLCAVLLCGSSALQAQTQLPPSVDAALLKAKIPREAIALLLVDAQERATPRLSHRAQEPMNPASLMKLLTTYAALDQLGPNFTWSTPVYVDGVIRDNTLFGNLHIKGQGDPKLVAERLWLLLRRVQGLGFKSIVGDIVLDRSAFELVAQDPGEFDGERLRPYNVAPDALLLNFKSVLMTFVPDRAAKRASVSYDLPLADVQMQTSVPLQQGECNDYRSSLRADFSDPNRIRFTGSYPSSCGERVWPVAYADPANHAARAIQGLWQEMGGKLTGTVRDGKWPSSSGTSVKPLFEINSAPLAELIRDINKYSNNVMAQQLFLTLSLQQKGLGSLAGSRQLLYQWWRERLGPEDTPVLDNGSGLSRHERITAQALARLLQHAYLSPLMPELMSSLPITGLDGTLKRSRAKSGGAHLKTGSLRDVAGVAGYVLGESGKRYILVVIVNHPQANLARPAIDALIDWTIKDG